MTIFDKICEHIFENTGYKVTFANDEELDGETRNETRGVLRVNTANRGQDQVAITENFGMYVEFSVVIDEEESFINKMRDYMSAWQSLSLDLEDGHIYKIYFQTLQPINYVQKISGVKFSTYVLQFTLNLFDNVMFSDDLLITINGKTLQGVIQYSGSSNFQRESHVYGGSNIPRPVGCTKIRTYNLTYMPVVGNTASELLFNIDNNLSENTITLGITFPYSDTIDVSPVIERKVEVYLTSFALSLQKGTFGQVACVFTEYEK